jgi:transposase
MDEFTDRSELTLASRAPRTENAASVRQMNEFPTTRHEPAAGGGTAPSMAAVNPLSAEQLAALVRWTDGDDARKSKRAQIILLSARGLSADDISRMLGVGAPTVYKWRRRFSRHGLSGLSDLPRSGQPRRLPKPVRDEILRVTREEKPPNGQRWSIRLAARHWGVTQHQIRQIWSDAALRPHTSERSQ